MKKCKKFDHQSHSAGNTDLLLRALENIICLSKSIGVKGFSNLEMLQTTYKGNFWINFTTSVICNDLA